MEYILQDIDIFAEDIGSRLHDIIKEDIVDFCNGKAYRLTVRFHMNLLNDQRFDEFVVTPSITNKGTRKDKIYDVMNLQLYRIQEVLSKDGIEIFSSSIEGDNIDSENIVKINIVEDTSEPFYMGKGKNKTRMKCISISPTTPYIREKVSKYAAESLSKMYCELMNVIKDRKLMSDILEINNTDDDKVLIRAFADQYGELYLATGQEREVLLNRLKEKILIASNKYFDKDIMAE